MNESANYKPSSELNNIPLASAEEERRRAEAWMDTAAQHLNNEEYWRHRAQQAEAKLIEQSGAALLPNNEVTMNIPVSGSPKAIKDVLEKFDETLVPLYMKIAPNCWEHDHSDGVFINCSMDANKNFKVLGLTKIDLKSKYRDITPGPNK